MSKLIGQESRSNTTEKYRHIYVIIEHFEGQVVPVSLEMLGEARRLMDDFNQKYNSSEKVVAVLLGSNVRKLCDELVTYRADSVIYAKHAELRYTRNDIDTRVIIQIAKDVEILKEISPEYENTFVKPRYMFFAADNIGRHLSSTVLVELESGLASDINKLVISDLDIRHEHKTKGQSVKYEKILEMYRPDFSGFLWTTILCLDNRHPANLREYHPQACSIIPGVFAPLRRDPARDGTIIKFNAKIEDADRIVKIVSRQVIESSVDFDSHKAVVSFGRGIKGASEANIRSLVQLAKEMDAEVGISLPISKRP